MPRSEAMARASKKYEQEKIERVAFRVPKGHREVIQSHAKHRGESVNEFINRAVNETIARDNEKKGAVKKQP